MKIIDVPVPHGHLIATGQKTVLSVSQINIGVEEGVAIRNEDVWRDWSTDNKHKMMEEDGAQFGPETQWGFNVPGDVVAVVDIERVSPKDVTATNVLRAHSLLITNRTEAQVLETYGQDMLAYMLFLTNIRPVQPTVSISRARLHTNYVWRMFHTRHEKEIMENLQPSIDELDPTFAT